MSGITPLLKKAWNRLEVSLADPGGVGLANIGGVIIIAGILYGGYTGKWPLRDSVLVILAVFLAAALWLRQLKKPVPFHKAALWLVALFVLVPLVQLIPLPPAIWQALPGHEVASAVYAAAQIEVPWLPISVVPQATLQSTAALAFPLAFFLLGAALPSAGAQRFLTYVAVGLGLSLVLGAMQMLVPGATGLSVLSPADGTATGLFENPNHFGFASALLVVLIPAVLGRNAFNAQSVSARLMQQVLIASVILIVVAIGIGSGSRAAIILALLALAFWAMESRKFFSARLAGRVFVGLSIAIAVLYFAAELTGTLKDSFMSGDQRPLIWSSSIALGVAHLPMGAGVGTFELAYLVHEPAETMTLSVINEAHNLYLQTLVEWGLAGFAMIALAVVGAARAYKLGFANSNRQPDRAPGLRAAAFAHENTERLMRVCLAALVLWAIHALVDYPERTMALGASLAFALGHVLNLVPAPEQSRPSRPVAPMGSPRPRSAPENWASRHRTR